MIVQAPYSQYIQGWIRPFLAAWAKCSSADRKRAGWELGPLIWRWIAAGKFSPKTDKVLDAATHRPSSSPCESFPANPVHWAPGAENYAIRNSCAVGGS